MLKTVMVASDDQASASLTLKRESAERVSAETGQPVNAIVGCRRPLSGLPQRKASSVQVRPFTLTIELARGRRYCATCQVRKTNWVVAYGPFNKHRRCFSCMTPGERAAFRSGY